MPCGSVAHQMHKRGIDKYYLQLLTGFTEWLTRLNYAKGTIRRRTRQLKIFLEWIEQRDIKSLTAITRLDVEAYGKAIHARPIKSSTIESYIRVLKLLNEYLESYGQAPVIKVKLRIEKEIEIERTIVTKEEVTKLYEACENTIYGMRDRVILAIFYGCGLRCMEGVNLVLEDIDFSNGLVHVRKGKNYKERYVPMSNGVSRIIQGWIKDGHSWFNNKSTNILIPSSRGKMLTSGGLNPRLKLLCASAQINKHITLHCLRHSIATHFLQSGMDLESIRQFLGHQSMETTKRYTRIVEEINEGV